MLFDLTTTESLGNASSSDSRSRTHTVCGYEVPDGCKVTVKSPRIGCRNELLALGFMKEFIMRRLDLDTESVSQSKRFIRTVS